MSITKLGKSVPFAASLAVLSAGFLIGAPAQAGLLGGGGGALGGGVSGGFTPRSLDIAGNAAGQVHGRPATLPQGPKDAAGDAAARGAGAAGTSQRVLEGLGAQAQGMGAAATAMPATTTPDASAAKPKTAADAQGGAGLTSRRGDASAAGSARARRGDRSLGADASADASVQR